MKIKKLESKLLRNCKNNNFVWIKELKQLIESLHPIQSNDKRMTYFLRKEAIRKNLYIELSALIGFQKQSSHIDEFSLGRKLLFNAIAKSIEYGDDTPESVVNEIVESGNLLNKSGGLRNMEDDLIWLFIPNLLHREIELMWFGIGEWKG